MNDCFGSSSLHASIGYMPATLSLHPDNNVDNGSKIILN